MGDTVSRKEKSNREVGKSQLKLSIKNCIHLTPQKRSTDVKVVKAANNQESWVMAKISQRPPRAGKISKELLCGFSDRMFFPNKKN